jgi:hypothetical protein
VKRRGAARRIMKVVRYFLTGSQPRTIRILLVESGSRSLLEDLIPSLRLGYGGPVPIDLVTCYAGLPRGLDPETTRVHRVADYRGKAGRKRLYAELAAAGYTVLGMICSDEPVMTKWKWALALRLPVKVFALNENGDYFWFDRVSWPSIRYFVLYRAGLAGAGAVRTLARFFLFPFTLGYLLLYATAVHVRRAVRMSWRNAR